ncbi:MAG: dihydropteroate synthase [Oceanobacter sp.]
MGILNVTPDSFSDGGCYQRVDEALYHAETMVGQGAVMVDVGGESTRPGASPVSEQEELDRVIPVVEALARSVDVCISIDTSTPSVMTAAATAGAHFLNDVRALERDGALEAAAATGLPVCLMHMKGVPASMQNNPLYRNVVTDVLDYLDKRLSAAESAGLNKTQLLIDPGFGFGKSYEHNYELLQRLDELQTLGVPVLAGLSRKTMIGQACGQTLPAERVLGSVAGAVACAMKGAAVLRVHDVMETVEALKVVRAMQGG